MASTGTVAVDFGAGATDARVVITGQAGIVAGSRVDAWIECTATAAHSADEHAAADLTVRAGSIVPGTGFTIYVATLSLLQFGTYSLGWAWV